MAIEFSSALGEPGVPAIHWTIHSSQLVILSAPRSLHGSDCPYGWGYLSALIVEHRGVITCGPCASLYCPFRRHKRPRSRTTSSLPVSVTTGLCWGFRTKKANCKTARIKGSLIKHEPCSAGLHRWSLQDWSCHGSSSNYMEPSVLRLCRSCC